jgi:hypothetical protein
MNSAHALQLRSFENVSTPQRNNKAFVLYFELILLECYEKFLENNLKCHKNSPAGMDKSTHSMFSLDDQTFRSKSPHITTEAEIVIRHSKVRI